MIKGMIQQENITIVSVYGPNIRAHMHKEILTKKKTEIDCNTRIVGDFNTPLTSKDRSFKQKINKETLTLNDVLDQRNLIDMYTTFHAETAKCTFFSSASGTFSRADHMLGH